MGALTQYYVDYGSGSDLTGDGSVGTPWKTIQKALDTIARDATNGDQINVKAGTAQVLAGALTLTTGTPYGAPTEAAPLILRGYTATANDGGIGEIDCGGFTMFAVAATHILHLKDLEIHNFGNNNGVSVVGIIEHCEIHKGASTPSSKILVSNPASIVGCYVHDAGSSGTGIAACLNARYNHVKDCPTGVNLNTAATTAERNIIVDSATGITVGADNIHVSHNSVYSSTANTGTGINASNAAGATRTVVLNNIIEGYSGSGGKGIAATGDLGLLGYNAFYNCATPESLGDVHIDLGNDATLSASPFTNAAGGDFSLNVAVVGAIDGAYPGAWYGPAGTTDHADIGAVQNGAGAGGGMLQANKRGNKL